MSVIYSHSMGGAKKSAGLITYRKVKGRTIASQKRQGSDASVNAFLGVNNQRCNAFALCQRFSAMHKDSINASFDSTKFGTPRNNFAKLNMPVFRAIIPAIAAEVDKVGGLLIVSDSDLDQYIADYCALNPGTMYRWKKSGYDIKYNVGAWDDGDNPVVEDPTAPRYIRVASADGTLLSSIHSTPMQLVLSGRNLTAQMIPVATSSNPAIEVYDITFVDANTIKLYAKNVTRSDAQSTIHLVNAANGLSVSATVNLGGDSSLPAIPVVNQLTAASNQPIDGTAPAATLQIIGQDFTQSNKPVVTADPETGITIGTVQFVNAATCTVRVENALSSGAWTGTVTATIGETSKSLQVTLANGSNFD